MGFYTILWLLNGNLIWPNGIKTSDLMDCEWDLMGFNGISFS